MKKKTILLMMVTVLAKVIGFLREIFLSYYFGASSITDAFMISLTIPGTLFAFIGAGILTSYIPIYNEIENMESKEVGYTFTSNLINILLLFSCILIAVVFLFTKEIVLIFASGFDNQILSMAVKFTRIGIISIIFSTLIYVFSGYLQMEKRIVYVAASGIPASLFVVLSIIFSSYYGDIYLSIGNTISILIQLLFLLPLVYFSGFRFQWIYTFRDRYLKKMLIMSLPVIMGMSVNQINVLVDKTIASRISVGGITSLTYANKINLFMQGIFVIPIATVLYIVISELASKNEFEKLKSYLVESVNIVGLLAIPVSVIAGVFSSEIVELLFARGAFSENAKVMTSSALMFYSIGMIGFGLREIFARVYYSIQDTKTPTINASIGMALNIILNIILSQYLGIGGLAFATSISGILTTLLLSLNLKRKIGEYGGKEIISTYIKIIIASIITAIVSKTVFCLLEDSFNLSIRLIISVFCGGLIYVLGVILVRIDEVSVLMEQLRMMMKRFVGGKK